MRYWDGWPIVIVVGAVLALIGAVVSIVMPISYYSAKRDCGLVHRQAGVETKWESAPPWQWDCYVKVNDGWIPLDRWRGIED
jgi:hypothetical protein